MEKLEVIESNIEKTKQEIDGAKSRLLELEHMKFDTLRKYAIYGYPTLDIAERVIVASLTEVADIRASTNVGDTVGLSTHVSRNFTVRSNDDSVKEYEITGSITYYSAGVHDTFVTHIEFDGPHEVLPYS